MSLIHSSAPHPSPATIGAGLPAEYITSARAKSPPGSTAAWRSEALGRPLTAIEQAADDEADAIRDRKEAAHALWLARLSDRERARLGIV